MALADFDQQQLPPYLLTGQMNPDGSTSAARFTGGNTFYGVGGPTAVPGLNRSLPFGATPPPITSLPPSSLSQRFNLATLFNGGSTAGSNTTPSMVATTRSPAVQTALNPAFATRTANAATEQQSLKDYAAQVLGGQPQAQQYGNEEINSIGQIYGTGGESIQAQLERLNRQQQSASNIAAQNAAGQVRRGINAARAGGGNSSYLDRLLTQQLYSIGANNAAQGAQQGRSDLTWLTGQRQSAVGRRQNILDTLAKRSLAPALANQEMESGALSNLGHLASLDYGNNQYQTPEDAWRQRLDFLDYLTPYFSA